MQKATFQNVFGEANRLKGDFNEAFKAFNIGSTFLNASDERYQRTRALIYHNISFLYQVQELLYVKALRYREQIVNILNQILPPFHRVFAKHFDLNGILH